MAVGMAARADQGDWGNRPSTHDHREVHVRKRIGFLIAAVLATFAILGSTAASAAGEVGTNEYETDYAVPHEMTTENPKYCLTGSNDVTGCFMPYGDILWLRDTAADGKGVKIVWTDLDGSRSGVCIDEQGKAAGWTRCNKNFSEGHNIRWQVSWYDAGKWQYGAPWTIPA